MTSVNEKSFADPMAAFEDGTSVQAESKCGNEGKAKQAEPAASPGADVDTFETFRPDPMQAEVARRSAVLQQKKAEFESKKTEAYWALPKLVPYGGDTAETVRSHIEFGKAVAKGDAAKAAEVITNTAGAGVQSGLLAAVGEAVSEGMKEVVEAAGPFIDAYDFTNTMRETGRAAREYEQAIYDVQDARMKADPNAKFPLAKIGGKTYSRQGGRLVSDQ